MSTTRRPSCTNANNTSTPRCGCHGLPLSRAFYRACLFQVDERGLLGVPPRDGEVICDPNWFAQLPHHLQVAVSA
jgi:hypothetical protein